MHGKCPINHKLEVSTMCVQYLLVCVDVCALACKGWVWPGVDEHVEVTRWCIFRSITLALHSQLVTRVLHKQATEGVSSKDRNAFGD